MKEWYEKQDDVGHPAKPGKKVFSIYWEEKEYNINKITEKKVFKTYWEEN